MRCLLLLDLREADPNLHGAIFNQEGERNRLPFPSITRPGYTPKSATQSGE